MTSNQLEDQKKGYFETIKILDITQMKYCAMRFILAEFSIVLYWSLHLYVYESVWIYVYLYCYTAVVPKLFMLLFWHTFHVNSEI